MYVTRPFKGVAVAALTAIGATLALAGPMVGTAFAAKPLPTPQPQITSGPQRPVSASSTADFVWTVASNTTYTCSLDGGKPSSCLPATSTTHSYANLVDGAHNFVLKAQIQPSGGTRYKASSAPYSWTVDTTPPAVPTITPLASTSSTTPQIDFSSDATAKYFNCEVDQLDASGNVAAVIRTGTTTSTTTGTTTSTTTGCTTGWPVTLPTGVNAKYRASVWAIDLYLNMSAPGTMTWTVDAQAPKTPTVVITQAPLTNQTVMDATMSTDDPGATYSCSIDGAPSQACGGTGATTTAHFNGPFTEGQHSLTVVATDSVKNTSVPKTAGWSVDLTAPAVAVLSGPASTTNQQTATFNVSVDDPTATLTCRIDGGSFVACPVGYSYAGPFDVGTHTFTVQAKDAAGNTAVSNSYGWTVNLSAPAPAYFLAGPSDPSNSTQATFDWDATDPVNTTGYACTLDGQTWPPSGSSAVCDTTTGPVTLTGLSDGTHVFGVTAMNSTTPSAEVRYGWTVDTQAPTAPVFSTTPATNSTTAVFSFASTGASHFNCALDNVSATVATAGLCASPVTYYNLAPGSHRFDVWATDAANNTSHSFWTWTINTSGPAAPAVGGPTGVVANTSTPLTWSDSDSSVQSSCTLDSNAAVSPCPASTSEGSLVDGPHAFAVTVSNSNGLTSKTIQWVVDTVSPAIQFTSVPQGTIGTNAVAPDIAVVDANLAATSCSLSDGSSVVATTCGPYLDLADATYSITVTATDQAGHTTTATSPSWTVDTTAPPAPGVDGPLSTSDTQPGFTFSDTELGVTFQCSTDGAAFSDCWSPYAVPTALAVGAHSLVVKASDSVGNAAASTPLAFEVTALPAPSVTGPSGLVGSATEPIGVSDTSSEATSLVCYLDGVSVGACAASYNVADGSHALVAYALNANLDQSGASTPLSWTVDTTAPVLSVTNAPSGTVSTTSASPAVTQTDANPGPISCSLTGPTPSSTCGPFDNLANGNYTFTASTTDLAGNVATRAASWTVQRLVTAPVAGPVDPAPTATLATPASLTGAATATFSETVHALTAGAVSIVLTGTSTVVPTNVQCLNGTAVVACSGTFTGLRLTPRSALTPGQHYTAQLAAGAVQDSAGNPSVATSSAFRASQNEQETSAAAHATWATVKATAAYGHSFVRQSAAGSTATYTFKGTNVTWWTVTGRNQGKATVFIDGVRKASVDNYASATHFKVARRYSKLANKSHTLRIVVRGLKGATAGTGTFVSIDAFSVGKTRTNTPTLTVTWRSLTAKQYSAAKAAASAQKGDALSFTFRGTAITWVTQRGVNQGKVAVYVDGVRKAVVDNYGAKTAFGVKRVVSKLSDTVHTLKLVVLGTHHKGATGTWVTVDRFQVS